MYELSGRREVYKGYQITEINAKEGDEYVSFVGHEPITLGEVSGEIDDDIIKRTQIRKTIEEHLNKELRLKKEGIKVLSLFFIDKVANYRFIDEDAYSLIMKDKEKLLSFDTKLKFIFSHSALKEGWDNPNVFQICTLNETKSESKKRQEIGRGLRLAVNQDGENTYLEQEASERIFNHLKEMKYIDNKGKITDALKTALKEQKVDVPEEFKQVEDQIITNLKKIAGIIKRKMRLMIVDGIKYEKIGDDAYYAQELFETQELSGYLSKNMIESRKSVYDYVIYDSDKEAEFAKKFEKNDSVKLYIKLPSWFKIETPLGTYNPDWAVLIEKDNIEKLYFVVETKGSILSEDLRKKEEKKIKCGHKHFAALGNEDIFRETDDFEKFIENV